MCCVFHSKRTAVPRKSEQGFHAIANKRSAATRDLAFLLGLRLRGQPAARLAHRFARERDAMRVVYQTVEDRVGDSRFADRVMPVIHDQLTGHKRGTVSVPVIENLKQIASHGVCDPYLPTLLIHGARPVVRMCQGIHRRGSTAIDPWLEFVDPQASKPGSRGAGLPECAHCMGVARRQPRVPLASYHNMSSVSNRSKSSPHTTVAQGKHA